MTVFEDPSLPHQLRLEADVQRGVLFVSCNCMQGRDGRYTPLTEPGDTSTTARGLAAFRAHIEEVSGS